MIEAVMLRRTLAIVVAMLLLGTWAAVAFEPTVKPEPAIKPDATTKPEPATKQGDAPAKSKATGRKGRHVTGFTPEREAAAMTFVRMHHGELAELLEQLKESNPQEYQRAIRDLFQSSEKLAQIEERNPHRYELELQDWKLNSRIQVLVARLTMRRDPVVEQELRQTLAEQLDMREQLLVNDEERAEAKLAEAQEHLAQFRRNREQWVDQRLNKLLDQTTAETRKN
ncbi:MAG TPA: hypothetical protein VHZ24_09220 [Pirellulales bacterium]|jgi:hypothetical protein|nr:hypothetical protein [Pirellulales bacterium]